MRKADVIICILTVFILSACGGTTEPEKFTSEVGGFSVNSPLPLEESTQTVDSALGSIEIHFFLGEEADRAFMIGYSDYPQDFIDQSDPQVMLDGAVDGAVANVNGELVSQVKISLEDRYPGREVVVTAMLDNDQEGTLKGQLYLVNNRLYQIMALAPSSGMDAQEMSDFINSFELLNP